MYNFKMANNLVCGIRARRIDEVAHIRQLMSRSFNDSSYLIVQFARGRCTMRGVLPNPPTSDMLWNWEFAEINIRFRESIVDWLRWLCNAMCIKYK